MLDFLRSNFSLLLECGCFVFCFLHMLFQHISNRKLGKKIDYFCSECHLPVYTGDDHSCPKLTSSQLNKLSDFVQSLIDENKGGD